MTEQADGPFVGVCVALAFLGVGIACAIWPKALQRLALKRAEYSIFEFQKDLVRTLASSPGYVPLLRVVGVFLILVGLMLSVVLVAVFRQQL